jgi:hypothetical protein
MELDPIHSIRDVAMQDPEAAFDPNNLKIYLLAYGLKRA